MVNNNTREHVKKKEKLAFLALTPHPLIAVSGTIAIYVSFFLYIDIYMLLKPGNSDIKNGLKKNLKCPLNKFIYRGNWKLIKTLL